MGDYLIRCFQNQVSVSGLAGHPMMVAGVQKNLSSMPDTIKKTSSAFCRFAISPGI